MIDPVLLREHPDVVRRSQETRGEPVEAVDKALAADRARRTAIARFEDLRAQQKQAGTQVRGATDANRDRLIREMQGLKDAVKTAEQAMKDAEATASEAMRRLPNVVIEGVPAGGEADFVTLRTWGEPATFDFTPRDHLELGERLGAIDMERGTKVSGSRFYYLTGIGARLELALLTMALDRAMAAGFTPMIVPTLVKPEVMQGTGFLGAHADEVYRLDKDDDLYLVGTSEVALAGYHMDEIVDLGRGPLRYAGWSTCYRREAGSYGKDTRGIIRVHQFDKLEMFVYTTPDAAEAEHEKLVALQEGMLQSLGLAYRVIDVAAGDLGSSAARKFDIEAWVPTQGAYRELTSTSNCTTFQSRRLDIRFRPDGPTGRTEFAATLNGTLATTRWIVAILETHQQADGSVVVPEALRGYLGGLSVLEPVA